jgi:glycosyltransferase involved in cell wall biosynthesis
LIPSNDSEGTNAANASMKVLFLTDNFVPEQNASARRSYEHCRNWVRQGVQVTVVTTVPNFPLGRPQPPYRNRLYARERIDGIEVVRVWSFLAPNSGVVLRALDFASFAVTGFFAGLFQKADIIVATSPQLLTAVCGLFLSRAKRRPWVFEVRDLWPESITAVGAMKEGVVMRLLRRLERSLYRSAERIVTVTEPMRARLIERGVPEEKVGVVPNGADLKRLLPRLASADLAAELKLEGKFVVGYVGTHGFAQGLEVVVKAAALVSDRNIHFLFVGEGARRDFLVKMAARLQLRNVTFVRGVPSDTAIEYLALCDAIVVPLKNSALFDGALPSKIFEAAAMEKPLLLSAKGLSADVVREHNAGIVAEPENQQALAAAVLRLHDDVALRDSFRIGCRALARQYNRETLANRMLDEIRFAAATAA